MISFGIAVIQLGLEQHCMHTALFVIIGGLQKDRRLARIHGRKAEIEFCHGHVGFQVNRILRGDPI